MRSCPNCGYPLNELSPREVEIEALLVKGMSVKEIAIQLGLSHKTVEQHRQAIYRKRNVHSQFQLIRRFHLGEDAAVGYLPPDEPRTRIRLAPNHPWRKDEESRLAPFRKADSVSSNVDRQHEPENQNQDDDHN